MGWYILIGIIALIIQIAFSIKFAECAETKGHDRISYFCLCLFFGAVGYLLVAALPDYNLRYQVNVIAHNGTTTPNNNNQKKSQTQTQTTFATPSTKKAVITDKGTWICGNCNAENNINYGQCKKCGKFRS